MSPSTECSFTPPGTMSPTAYTFAVEAFSPRIARPLFGSEAAMIPVRTRGMLVCGALLALVFATGLGVPNRPALAMVAALTRGAGGGSTGAELADELPAFPPVRSVRINAACTPSASASTQVATRGPCASASDRHRSEAGMFSSQDAAFIGWTSPQSGPLKYGAGCHQDAGTAQAGAIIRA